MKSKFYKSKLLSYYICSGLVWFRFLMVKISFKHINNYNFEKEDIKGFFLGYWLIKIN